VDDVEEAGLVDGRGEGEAVVATTCGGSTTKVAGKSLRISTVRIQL
jgi:hypothetical protein